MILLKLALIVVFYTALVFGITMAERLGTQSGKTLAKSLTWKRLLVSGAISALLIAATVYGLHQAGWIKFGAAPYASPGFDTQRPEVASPVEPAGPAPKIDAKVDKGTIENTSDAHQRKLRDFEGRAP